MNWTEADLRAFTQRRLRDEKRTRTEIYAKNNAAPKRLHTDEPERAQGSALVSGSPRETESGAGPAQSFAVRFIVRSRRPCDWDNLAGGIKPLQDLLVAGARILPDDNWKVLQGHIVSEKAASKEDESTTVIIESL